MHFSIKPTLFQGERGMKVHCRIQQVQSVPRLLVTIVHPALNFTVEKEQNKSLNFLNVSVKKGGTGLLISIYRKLTFTGQYIRWNSFSPKTRKINRIKTFLHRALMICSRTKLDSELDRKELPDSGNKPTANWQRISRRCPYFLPFST